MKNICTLLLLRHDSIGILPLEYGLSNDITVVQKGDFCIYDETEEYSQKYKGENIMDK